MNDTEIVAGVWKETLYIILTNPQNIYNSTNFQFLLRRSIYEQSAFYYANGQIKLGIGLKPLVPAYLTRKGMEPDKIMSLIPPKFWATDFPEEVVRKYYLVDIWDSDDFYPDRMILHAQLPTHEFHNEEEAKRIGATPAVLLFAGQYIHPEHFLESKFKPVLQDLADTIGYVLYESVKKRKDNGGLAALMACSCRLPTDTEMQNFITEQTRRSEEMVESFYNDVLEAIGERSHV